MLVSLGLLACQKSIPVNIVQPGRLTIIDSAGRADQPAPFDSTSRSAYYPVYFIGSLADTFPLGVKPISWQSSEELESKYSSIRKWTLADSDKMRIHVDTNLFLASQETFCSPQEGENAYVVDAVRNYQAFPIFI